MVKQISWEFYFLKKMNSETDMTIEDTPNKRHLSRMSKRSYLKSPLDVAFAGQLSSRPIR